MQPRAAFLGALVMYVAGAAPAMAGPPVIQRSTEVYSQEFWCRGGPFVVDFEAKRVLQCRGKQGQVAQHNEYKSTITNPATGFSVSDPGVWSTTWSGAPFADGTCPEGEWFATSTASVAGSTYHLTVPGQGVVALDSGLVTIDQMTGEFLFEAGPHDGFDGTFDVCEFLGLDECPEGTIDDCFGGCAPAEWIDDDYCDFALDCPQTGFDGGDCLCNDDEIKNCWGQCTLISQWGDSICDDELACPALEFDNGDCCTWDEVEDCDGNCFAWGEEPWTLGDGTCDAAVECPLFGFDHGDCACGEGYIEACDGTCLPANWVGDDICDIALDCEAYDYDGGDCVCGDGAVAGCQGGCFPAWWLGDEFCDFALDCEATGYDGGDCPAP